MVLNLRERFGPKEPTPHRLLAQDFEFSAASYPSLRAFSIERNEIDMLEKPLAVTRRYVLSHGPAGLQLEFVLCLSGADAAVSLLFERASAFQREPAAEALIDVAAALHIGDVGVAWRWDAREPDGVLAFVRYNVLVFMRGPFEALQEQARELDSDLALRQTSTEYTDSGGMLLAMPADGGVSSVESGARLDLGSSTSAHVRPMASPVGMPSIRSPAGLSRTTRRSASTWRMTSVVPSTTAVSSPRSRSRVSRSRLARAPTEARSAAERSFNPRRIWVSSLFRPR